MVIKLIQRNSEYNSSEEKLLLDSGDPKLRDRQNNCFREYAEGRGDKYLTSAKDSGCQLSSVQLMIQGLPGEHWGCHTLVELRPLMQCMRYFSHPEWRIQPEESNNHPGPRIMGKPPCSSSIFSLLHLSNEIRPESPRKEPPDHGDLFCLRRAGIASGLVKVKTSK